RPNPWTTSNLSAHRRRTMVLLLRTRSINEPLAEPRYGTSSHEVCESRCANRTTSWPRARRPSTRKWMTRSMPPYCRGGTGSSGSAVIAIRRFSLLIERSPFVCALLGRRRHEPNHAYQSGLHSVTSDEQGIGSLPLKSGHRSASTLLSEPGRSPADEPLQPLEPGGAVRRQVGSAQLL